MPSMYCDDAGMVARATRVTTNDDTPPPAMTSTCLCTHDGRATATLMAIDAVQLWPTCCDNKPIADVRPLPRNNDNNMMTYA